MDDIQKVREFQSFENEFSRVIHSFVQAKNLMVMQKRQQISDYGMVQTVG